MYKRDLGDFREWAAQVLNGELAATPADVSRVVTELLDEIDHLHNRYAREGGRPQVLTVDILIEWVKALHLPEMVNVYMDCIPNTFSADFALTLDPPHIAQLAALGLVVVDMDDVYHPFRGRYMLKWNPPPSDEC